MPRKPPPAPQKGPRKPLPEELARDAIAHEDDAPGARWSRLLRVVLVREQWRRSRRLHSSMSSGGNES
jgi:hypothetical protein